LRTFRKRNARLAGTRVDPQSKEWSCHNYLPFFNLSSLDKDMTKSELVDAIASGAGLSKSDAASALQATLDAVESALKSGDSVSLIGFGTFSVVKRSARMGRNPQKPGEQISIPASKAVKFKVGSKLKAAVK
jgi:DNA-binding protein HU-beta